MARLFTDFNRLFVNRSNHVSACVLIGWVMILSVVAREFHYAKPENDFEYQILLENKVEPVAAYFQIEGAEDNQRKDRLLSTLLQNMQNPKDIDSEGPSPKFEHEDLMWSDFFGLKKAGVKRWLAALSNNASSKLMPRNLSQFKWKIKKGTSVVCFFKLCSFKQST